MHGTIEHPADMGIFGRGDTLAVSLEEAALAMFELVVDAEGLGTPTERLRVSCEADDPAELLLEFLNALITAADIADLVFVYVEILSIVEGESGWRIEADASGMRRSAFEGRLLAEVKAATPCGLHVGRDRNGRWESRCVLDL